MRSAISSVRVVMVLSTLYDSQILTIGRKINHWTDYFSEGKVGAMAKARKPAPKARNTASRRARSEARIARRERRRESSREEILAAARRVLLKNGITATTLEAVAQEAGLSKTALYYYFASKDALLFELIFALYEEHANKVHETVETTKGGGEALRAIIRETVQAFAGRLDDFRLAFMHGQVAGQGAVHFDEGQFARIRPLNNLWFAGAAERIAADRKTAPSRAKVEPRLMAFLAFLAALGLLTMKGMVESVEDPLVYSDDQMIEGLARIFEAAEASG
jgi:AcrR family transcriptional regulator